MPGEHLSLSKSSLAFAKLAATPTEKAWSQAYNAGNLFACLSLTANEQEELHALQTLGKELFSNLEAEFFTLEEKNLTTISEAVKSSIKHIPETISVDFCLGFFKEDALYLFIFGGGRVIMKRGEKLGVLLEKTTSQEKTLQSASGLLENGDTIILETTTFAKNVSDKHLSESLQLTLPSDIAETLSLHMHEKPDGDQAAIIIVYHGSSKPTFAEENDTEITLSDRLPQEAPVVRSRPSLPRLPRMPKLINFSLGQLNHRKKLFLSVSVIILLLLVISISFTKQKQQEAKNKTLFESIYNPALQNYDEAKGLQNLNPVKSMEELQQAERLLEDGKDKLPQGSKEDKQIEDLLAKVQQELSKTSESSQVTEVTLDPNDILNLEKANADGNGFSQNTDSVFFATDKAAFSIDKKSAKKKELATNDDDWQKALSVVPYQANFYILDSKNGVLKYVPTSDTYNKNSYFKDSPDLSKAISMAIDSAIWVLFSDGTLNKYVKGEKQAFAIKGLDKPVGASSKIVTDSDMEHLYILDTGASRIVVVAKDGTFQKQYTAGVIKQAKDFEVLEKDKKINLLVQDKTYQLSIE